MLRLAIVALFAICLPVAALAAPPGAGSVITRTTIVCDTKEQMVSVMEAGRDHGWDAFMAKLKEYRALPDANNERSCDMGMVSGVIIVETVLVGNITKPDASVTAEWAVHVTAPVDGREAWVMWSEPVDPANKTSIPVPPPVGILPGGKLGI